MLCPQCGAEYREGFDECADCHVPLVDSLDEPEPVGPGVPEVLIRTEIWNPIAIGLAETLLREARIRYFVMDRNVAARQESGNIIGWWTIRVPEDKEAEAREILRSVEDAK